MDRQKIRGGKRRQIVRRDEFREYNALLRADRASAAKRMLLAKCAIAALIVIAVVATVCVLLDSVPG